MVLCLLDDASDRCTFFQETRMCIRRCLHSSMISILCTASWDQSRTIQTAPHCPCPESFSWDSYWTGRRLFCCRSCWRDNRWGDSRSSWQVHEHDRCQLVSQQNVAIHEFWSRCHPRLPLIARDLHHEWRKTTGFSVLSWFVSSSTLKFVWSAQGKLVSRSIMIWDWVWLAWLCSYGLLNNLSICLSSNFWTQLFHPIMLQRNLWRKTKWRKNFFVYDFSSFHPNNFRDTISWKCFVEDDGVRLCLILQSFLQSNVDVAQYIGFWCLFHAFRMDVQGAVLPTRSCQDACVLCPKDPQTERILSVCCSKFDVLVSTLNWWWNADWLHIQHG